VCHYQIHRVRHYQIHAVRHSHSLMIKLNMATLICWTGAVYLRGGSEPGIKKTTFIILLQILVTWWRRTKMEKYNHSF
jgi:hypothetical protein